MTTDSSTQTVGPTPETEMNIRVYNTLSRQKEPFVPVQPGRVGIYVCGPTVYREAHIGHMVGPVVFDTIKRYLAYNGLQVTWVVNITDVDDKLIVESQRRGIPMAQVAAEMTEDYLANLRALGVDQIDRMPRATDHIDEIIRFIEQLIEAGYAYESEGDVYFEVGKDAHYGKLSNRTLESLQGEGGEAAGRKRALGDFALWKSAKPGEPSWPSPWGPGRPGWHIECSAMSRALLGTTFDIHGGGLDLVFPHHENEIAQSECCHGQPMVRYWMHNGLVRAATHADKIGSRTERQQEDAQAKLSRSKGAGGLSELIRRWGGECLRFFLLRTHYRSTILFSEEGLAEASTALDSFYRYFQRFERIAGQNYYKLRHATRRSVGDAQPGSDPLGQTVAARRHAFLTKMDDDFNTAGAISELFELVRELNRFIDQHQLDDPDRRATESVTALRSATTVLRELAAVLGLFTAPPAEEAGHDQQLIGKLVQLLIDLRAEARRRKDFALADRIREGLAALQIALEDRKDQTTWSIRA